MAAKRLPRWKLKGNLGLHHSGSGQNDTYYVQMLYSDKLGFRHGHGFDNRADANGLIQTITQRGWFTPQRWRHVFNPLRTNEQFPNTQYID